MDAPELGHAVIVNNVARDFPGSFKDVEVMGRAFERMGLEVDEHTNLSQKVGAKLTRH